jgi:hypothetical protein
MEVTRIRGRRRKKLLDDLKDRRAYSHLKEDALIAVCGGIVLEETLNLSSDRILNECMDCPKKNEIEIKLRKLEVSGKTSFNISGSRSKLTNSYVIWNIKK